MVSVGTAPFVDFSYLAALLDESVGMVVVTDAQGEVRWANALVAVFTGVALAELMGRNILEFVHPDEVERLGESMQTTASRLGSADPIEARVRAASGVWTTCEVIANNRLDDDIVRGVVWHARDVTARLALQRRFRRLFENNPLPSALVRAGAIGVFGNEAFAELLP